MTERLETTTEHVARDIKEGRFPKRSEPQIIREDNAWTRILLDPQLASARRKLSGDELRRIIRHVFEAKETGLD